MQYLLMIYGNEAAMQSAGKQVVEQMQAAYGAYTGALQEAGVIRGGERLGRAVRRAPSGSRAARPRCWMGLMPRPRSSSAATI